MTDDPFHAALSRVDAAMVAGDPDRLDAAMQGFRDVPTVRTTRAALLLAFDLVGRMLEASRTREPAAFGEVRLTMLAAVARDLVERLVTDVGGDRREFVQNGINRALARVRLKERGIDAPIPRPHRPLDHDEAAELLDPFFRSVEAEIEEDPYAHLPLVWKVLLHPVTPFDTLFAQWLERLDRDGIGTGDNLPSIRRAMALSALAENRKQRVNGETVKDALLPQLRDTHPMVAACAARYLGVVYSDPGFFVTRGTPPGLSEVLGVIASLPGLRRPVAGGFLMGYSDYADPFYQLKSDPALDGCDVDDWVLEVLADNAAEPYLPGTQAFWFQIHESYCTDIPFITRLIDAGHLDVALMTATEIGARVDGMRDVLERLATCGEPETEMQASQFLTRVWSDG